jgi:pimeloyl-ACP methyl ester carboxylesterase
MIKQFRTDNIEIACWINPSDFGAHQQSLVFIHGSGSDHTCWSYQYSGLHQQFNVVAVDLPGHGSSTGSGENDVEKYCLWIKKLLAVMQIKKPVLIGHSLGAAMAMTYALRYPQDISGIVPVGGGIKMPVNPDLLAGLKTNTSIALDLICKFSLAKENRPQLLDILRKSMSAANVDVLYDDLSACDKLDLTTNISKINTPALVLCGQEDKMTPPDLSRRIVEGITGAKLCLIAGAGHMVMLERPAEVNRAVGEFASSISIS